MGGSSIYVFPRVLALPRPIATPFGITVLSLRSACWFLAFFPPPPPKKTLLQGTYFGSSTSDTRNELLSISCGSWLTVYVGLCPHLPIALASLLVLPL